MCDERHEQGAVEPVLVEIVRRHVRGGDHHHATLEQLREQPAEDHRVRDVGDMKFVEAQQPGFLARAARHELDRILARMFAELSFPGAKAKMRSCTSSMNS